MTVTCPSCGEELDILGDKELAVGDQIQCDGCGEILEVSETVGGNVSGVESTMGGDEIDEEPEDSDGEDEDDEDSELDIDEYEFDEDDDEGED